MLLKTKVALLISYFCDKCTGVLLLSIKGINIYCNYLDLRTGKRDLRSSLVNYYAYFLKIYNNNSANCKSKGLVIL